MPIKQALLVIVIGSSALISINALNTAFYSKITWFLLAQMLTGLVIPFLLAGEYKKHTIRIIVFIFTLAGVTGLLHVLGEVAETYVYGNNLRYPNSLYIYHSLTSLVFTAVFFIWYALDKKSGRKK